MSNSLKHKLQGQLHAAELKNLNEELASTRRHLAIATEQLQKARDAKAAPITPAKPRTRAQGDKVRVLFGDLHGCHQDPKAVAALMGDIKALDPDEIIIGGDMVDCGGHLAQHHVMGYVAETEYTYEDDIAATNAFLDVLMAAAPKAKIEYVEGNHERRVETWCVTQTLRNKKDSDFLRRNFAPEFLLRLKERGIDYFRQGVFYDGLPIPGTIKRGKVFITHGFSTAEDAAGETMKRVGGNVVFFHVHRAMSKIVRRVASGTVGGWCPGMLCRPQPLWQHTRPSDWTAGYAIEFVAKSEQFLHVQVPITEHGSLLVPLLNHA